jgi:hypothetical protein
LTEKEGAKTEHRKTKRKKMPSLPDYPSCSHVMQVQVEGMERIAPAPPTKTSLTSFILSKQNKMNVT